ncbi:hypothetical protein NBRC10512_002192 [Rhodotorula toruloides]|uniref:RHTO0S02e10880g1_1 n=2 Tax=Rhodotorula toruloides TaxID=5286 RepID=A0A061AHS9_RHOTO|nr:expansin family protein [Rhodotorula toruloides NP11]EMS23559.1 expansin family protein [Rhodotorula toruloides NP11]CDR37107.1 RHTO0S02e10880g1_1 [Rhodotorula toruloides]
MPSLTSLVTFLALALPLASAGAAHYSHPRNAALVARNAHGRVAGKARTLPRTGRRLSKRQEATLKCLTAYTFALCDGDNCTDMGSVAAGTMCQDGAITWDTGAGSAPPSSGIYSPPAQETVATTPPAQTTPAAAKTTTTAAQSSASVDKKLANNAVQSTTSSAAAAQTSAPAVQLNVGGSGSSSSDSSSIDTSSDDWVCDDETSTSSAAPQTSADTGVQSVKTSAPAPTPTTTSSAPAQTSSASSGGGQVFTGQATYYYQYGVAGSCGNYNSDSDYIVAVNAAQMNSGWCGKTVHITNTATGASITATIADTCPGCAEQSLDLSQGAFDALGSESQGVLPISWGFSSEF